MSEIAIRVEGVGKQYRIGARRGQYRTLRETLASMAAISARAARSFVGPKKPKSDSNAIWALKDISFDVGCGEVVGLIGRNGAGKSTLLKVLSRITEPTTGKALIRGRIGSLLEVGTGFHPELTGRENIYLNGAILGMRKAEIKKKFDEIVYFSDVEKFIDTQVKHYSSGMYLRLAFAVAANLETEILLVDEVLAVGDAEFQKRCLGKMKDVARSGRTILFVSHSMEAILSLCSSCFVVSGGKIGFQGSAEDSVNFYYKALSGSTDSAIPHVLYDGRSLKSPGETAIVSIEMLDAQAQPKASARTWDDVIFRVHYESAEAVRNGSIVLEIKDYKDQRLITLDSGLKVPLRQGQHFVDCYVPRLPLPSGEYFLAAGLADSNIQWIWPKREVGSLRVHAKDVFDLGRPPAYSRMMFAAAHEWQESNDASAK